MYQDFFSLKELPFSISPDPEFLFLSDRHKEAIAHLQYGVQGNGGFVLLTGEVGTGKTTVCRRLLQNLPTDTDIAFILNPALTEIELLATICDEFKIEYDKDKLSLKLLFDSLTAWMMNNHQQGRNAIVLIDEAQHLSFSVLEQLRLLTNIESNNKKPLQVILIGQTELQQKLKQNELRQLAQRITARYHLLPLTEQECEYYVRHRLHVAGTSHPIFDRKALQQLFKLSQGIPRLINLLCDRSLLCAYTEETLNVNAAMLKKAALEIDLSDNNSAAKLSFKSSWRFAVLLILTVLTAVQLPEIIARIELLEPVEISLISANPVVKPVQVIASTPIQENIIQEKSKTPIVDEPLDWFDAYHDLDISNASYVNALVNLYAVWGYQTETESVNCEQGKSVLLSCYSTNSSLNRLKKLNYPSIVKLEKQRGQSIYVVIYKITDNYQLLIDGQLIEVSETWFNKYWSGELTLLWQAPFALQNSLKFGQQNEKIAWLVSQLNRVQGKPAEQKNRFDLSLLQQVSAFQRAQGIKDDGIVGTQTLMPLMQIVNPELPRLQQGLN